MSHPVVAAPPRPQPPQPQQPPQGQRARARALPTALTEADQARQSLVISLFTAIDDGNGKPIYAIKTRKGSKAVTESLYGLVDALKCVDEQGRVHIIAMSNIAAVSPCGK